MTKKRIHFIYGILLSAALVLAGLCLIVACVQLYQAGDKPFSREAVAAAFQTIAIPVYGSLLLLLGSIVLNLCWPTEQKKTPLEKQYAVMLHRQLATVDLQYCAPHLRAAIGKQEKSRKIHKSITLVLLGVCSAGFLFYGVNLRNFPLENINGVMIKAMGFFIPCLLLPFLYGIFTAYYCRRSIRRELELVRQAKTEGCPAPASKSPAPVKKNQLPAVQAAIVLLAVAILLFGFFSGGAADVLTKAVNICTECVGLG